MIRLPDQNNPAVTAKVRNRLPCILVHAKRYTFKGYARLAFDAGISHSALSKVLYGQRQPTYLLVTRIVGALEKDLGIAIDPRDVFTEEDSFRHTYPCDACHCNGCYPPWAYDENDILRPAFALVEPGRWTEETGSEFLSI